MTGGTRRQILEAAVTLAYAKGLSRVTTKALARATGLSEGALYRHFEHKEDVFLAALEENLPIMAEAFGAATAGSGSVKANLAAILRAALRYYEQIVPLGASFFADVELLGRMRALMQEIGGPQRLFERVATYVAEEQSLGRIAPGVPALDIASALLGPAFQRAFLRKLLGDAPDARADRRFAEGQLRILLPGILPPAGPAAPGDGS